MADDQNASATIADIALVLAELRASESRVNSRFDKVNTGSIPFKPIWKTSRWKSTLVSTNSNTAWRSFFSDMEARVGATIYRLGESGMQRFTSAERDAAVLKDRIATLEERLIRIEKRLDLPPAQANS